jgi:hypothetical protein
MNKSKSSLFEPFASLLLGLTSVIEGIRLIINSDQQNVYQALGPGGYILLVGLALMICSLVYAYFSWVRNPSTVVNKPVANRGQKSQIFKVILAMILYIT